MSHAIVCSECHATLPTDSTHGLCPLCLMRLVSTGENIGNDPDCSEALDSVALSIPQQPSQLGRYRIQSEIGRGGMGRVYEAIDTRLGRTVAIKTLAAGRDASIEDLERFQAEATAASALHHPHIISVYEVGVEDGTPFIAMSMIDGPSLQQELAEGPLSPKVAAQLTEKLASAIVYAHEQGVVHRDLKPSNILMDQWAGPKIADFGLGKREDTHHDLTVTGQIVGTPSYIAPEQISGKAILHPQAIDIYGLGAVLYAMLTGRPPFQTDNALKTLEQVQNIDPAPPSSLNPNIPRDLESICLKCLEKEPRRRYANASELLEDLIRFQAGKTTVARRVGIAGRTWRLSQRNPVAATLIGLLCLSMMVGATASFYFASRLWSATIDANTARSRAQTELHKSLLMQARFGRMSLTPGQRHNGLSAIVQAARIQPTQEARDEAIACLTLLDVETTRHVPISPRKGALVEFNRDLSLMACVTHASVEVYETRTAVRVRQFAKDSALPLGARFSSDSKRLTVIQRDGQRQKLVVHDLETGQEIGQLPTAVGYNVDPDGGWISVITAPRTVDVIDLATLSPKYSLPIPAGHNVSRISVDGSQLATWQSGARHVSIWNLNSGACNPLETPGPVQELAWSRGGDQVLTAGVVEGSTIHTANIWHLPTQQLVCTLQGHAGDIRRIYFSPTDDLVATSAWDGTTRFWDSSDGRELLRIPGRLLKWHRDGRRLLVENDHGMAELRATLNRAQRTLKAEYRRHAVLPIAFSSDGRWLAAGLAQGTRVWDVSTLSDHVRRPVSATLGSGSVESVAFADDGGMWTSGSAGITRWNLTDSVESNSADYTIHPGAYELRMSATRDGSLLAARRGSTALLLNPRDGVVLKMFQGPAAMSRLDLSPGGEWLAVGSWKGDGLVVWNTSDGEARSLLADKQNVLPRFSHDGRWLAAGDPRGYYIWDTRNWNDVLQIERSGKKNVQGVCDFSHDGQWIAIADTLTNIRIFRVQTGELIASLPVDAQIYACRFSPDDRLLAVSCPTKGSIQVWNLAWVQQQLAPMQLSWDSR